MDIWNKLHTLELYRQPKFVIRSLAKVPPITKILQKIDSLKADWCKFHCCGHTLVSERIKDSTIFFYSGSLSDEEGYVVVDETIFSSTPRISDDIIARYQMSL